MTTKGAEPKLDAAGTAVGDAYHPELRAGPPLEPDVERACLSRLIEARTARLEAARDFSRAREAGITARMVRSRIHAV